MKFFIGILFLAIVPAIWAQDYASRGEVFGSIGGGKAYDDEGRLGNGYDFGGGAGLRLTPKVGLEAQVNSLRYKREFSFGGRLEGTATFTTANLVYHFSTKRAQPYAFGGVGFVHHENRSQFTGVPFPGNRTGNGFASNFGAGIKIFLNKNISLRPEFRVLIGDAKGSGVEAPFSVMRGSIGIAYHW